MFQDTNVLHAIMLLQNGFAVIATNVVKELIGQNTKELPFISLLEKLKS